MMQAREHGSVVRRRLRPRNSAEVLSILTVAYSVILPFDIVPGAFGRSVAFPVLALLLVAWVATVWKGGPSDSVDPRFLILALSLAAWVLVTTAWSFAPMVTLVSAMSHVLQVLTVMALSVSIPGRAFQVLGGLTHGTVVMGVLVLLARPDPDRAGRASIFQVDENITGMVLAIGFSAAIGCAIALGRKKMSVLFVLEALIIAAAIMKGGSRSAFVAVALTLLVTTVILVIVSKGLGWRQRSLFLAMVCVGPILIFFVLNLLGLVPQRIVELVASPFEQDDSLRGEITSQYLKTMDAWVWRGVGFGVDDEYLVSTGEGTQNVHQTFWRVWVEAGAVGLALFLLLLAGVAAAAIKRRTNLTQTILLAVPLAFTSLTLGGIDRTTNFWFVIAFAVAGTGGPLFLKSRRGTEHRRPTATNGDGGPTSCAATATDGSRTRTTPRAT